MTTVLQDNCFTESDTHKEKLKMLVNYKKQLKML